MLGAAGVKTAAAAAAAPLLRLCAAARGVAASVTRSSSSKGFYCSSGGVLGGAAGAARLPLEQQLRLFSSSSDASSSSSTASGASGAVAAAAESLASTLQKEILHEKSSYEADKQLAQYLEANKWLLQEKNNDMLVTLTKDVEGCKVSVEFSCIQPSGGDEEEGLPEASDFTVSVQHKDGSGLLFYCSTTSEDENARFCIGQVRYYATPAGKDSLSEYPGPYFEDLDDAFQLGLDGWLASLGVDASLCDFIDRYVADKENREYISWLSKVHEFVKKQ